MNDDVRTCECQPCREFREANHQAAIVTGWVVGILSTPVFLYLLLVLIVRVGKIFSLLVSIVSSIIHYLGCLSDASELLEEPNE